MAMFTRDIFNIYSSELKWSIPINSWFLRKWTLLFFGVVGIYIVILKFDIVGSSMVLFGLKCSKLWFKGIKEITCVALCCNIVFHLLTSYLVGAFYMLSVFQDAYNLIELSQKVCQFFRYRIEKWKSVNFVHLLRVFSFLWEWQISNTPHLLT